MILWYLMHLQRLKHIAMQNSDSNQNPLRIHEAFGSTIPS